MRRIRVMSDINLEMLRIKQRIEQNKLELKKTEEELSAVGTQMKKEYVQQLLIRWENKEVAEAPGLVQYNRLCRSCFCGCKQPDTVMIFHCGNYEKITG